METSSSSGATDMDELGSGCKRPLQLTRKHPVPSALLPVHKYTMWYTGTAVAHSLFFTTSLPDGANSDQDERAGFITDMGPFHHHSIRTI